MIGKLTTHVLDTSKGKPAGQMVIELWKYNQTDENFIKIKECRTNVDGRVDKPLLEGEEFEVGIYELVFRVADYYKGEGKKVDEYPFLHIVPIRFGIGNRKEHYHVPLLIAPGGYSTYRGS
ncbi:hydroxyisourate hydrolase [Evansella sp. AB-P1]|uniref:hydroxyisourate hydrolase n=1 Tax=Evansella sp. AB-P1 TaxID=3037653 RepID=UPI00241F187D|nr:hydroxyisourate hydrolase [Evansella sp. AB-P1]MDG5787904.1 hydroxyisourate hydrolase [Evansella sp. AB-P1]